MARKTKLQGAAAKIGMAVGKADRTAHKVVGAAHIARQELVQLGKQVDALKKQLAKSSNRLKRALQ